MRFLDTIRRRLEIAKNITRLIKAIHLIDPGINLKLIIVGKGESEVYLKSLVKKLGLQDKISFPGYVSTEEIIDYFNSADLIAYLPINEPFGLVPLEAMSCGKIVLGSSIGGTSETIVDKETGFLCDPFDIEQIARKIEYVYLNKNSFSNMASNAKERFKQFYSLEKGVARFEKSLIYPFLKKR